MTAQRRTVVLGAVTGLIVLAALALITGLGREVTASSSEFIFGTYVKVTVTGRGAAAAAERAIQRMKEIDRLFDPGEAGSDIARLSAAAGLPGDVTVSSDTLALLAKANEAYRLSGGAFDPTVGPLVSLWGFGPQDPAVAGTPADTQRTEPPDAAGIQAARALVGWSSVRWDDARSTAALLRPGMALNSGGLGKGYAIDEAVAVLLGAGVKRAVIDAGGELYLLGEKPGGQVWRIGVRHPRQNGHLGVLELGPDVAVATSGDYQRFFDYEGRRFHHLIDPATGWPATGCRSVTVVARTSVEADYLSTALFVLGPEEGLRLAETLPGVQAVFVNAQGGLVVTSGLKDIFVPTEGGDGGG